MQRAFDQVVHDVALMNLPVVFCLDRAGLVGEDGPTHHGAFDISFLRAIPNLQFLAPADEAELKNAALCRGCNRPGCDQIPVAPAPAVLSRGNDTRCRSQARLKWSGRLPDFSMGLGHTSARPPAPSKN